jgi:hypothetical protein
MFGLRCFQWVICFYFKIHPGYKKISVTFGTMYLTTG